MIVVVACGAANRCDDGVAGEVLRRLAAGDVARSPEVKLLDAGTDGLAVMFAARGARSLIVIDACRGAAEPGAVFEVPAEVVARERAPGLSSHDFRWEDALAAGRRILKDQFPADATVMLIEGADFGFGVGLSPAVEAGAAKAAARIEALVAARLEAA